MSRFSHFKLVYLFHYKILQIFLFIYLIKVNHILIKIVRYIKFLNIRQFKNNCKVIIVIIHKLCSNYNLAIFELIIKEKKRSLA